MARITGRRDLTHLDETSETAYGAVAATRTAGNCLATFEPGVMNVRTHRRQRR